MDFEHRNVTPQEVRSFKLRDKYVIYLEEDESYQSVGRAILKSVYELADIELGIELMLKLQNISMPQLLLDLAGTAMIVDEAEKKLLANLRYGNCILLNISKLANEMIDSLFLPIDLGDNACDYDFLPHVDIIQTRKIGLALRAHVFSDPSRGPVRIHYITLDSFIYSGERLTRMLEHAKELVAESK